MAIGNRKESGTELYYYGKSRPCAAGVLRKAALAAIAAAVLLSFTACERHRAGPHVQRQSAEPHMPQVEAQSHQSADIGNDPQRGPGAGNATPRSAGSGPGALPPISAASDDRALVGHTTVPNAEAGAARSGDAGPAATRNADTSGAGAGILPNASATGPATVPNAAAGAARSGDAGSALPPDGPAPGAAGPATDTGTPAAPRAGTGGKVAYLTFDDGPSASTERLLAILRRYGVKATFFVVGTTSEEGKALYRAIAADGHVLGNHTFSHDYRTVYRSPEAFRQDVDKLNALLEETTGRRPDILRYPGGSNNKQGRKYGGAAIMSRIIRDMRAQGYQYFDWSVSSTDAAAPVQERDVIVGSVLSASRGLHSAIVLMHDNARKTTTLEALPTVIEGLRRQGFTFDVLRRSTEAVHFLEPD